MIKFKIVIQLYDNFLSKSAIFIFKGLKHNFSLELSLKYLCGTLKMEWL